MLKRTVLAGMAFFLFFGPGNPGDAFAQLELVGKDGVLVESKDSDWQASLDGSLRLAFNGLGHVVTLDHDDKKDMQYYMGEMASLGLDVKYKEEYEGYIKFSSYGAGRYDVPVLPRGTVRTIYGDVGDNAVRDIMPRLQEWWVTGPFVPGKPFKGKAGLFTYSVGNGLALGGYYENYGADISLKTGSLKWTGHFAVPDIENKWYLGPYIPLERTNYGVKYNSRAYFFAADVVAALGEGSFVQPYLGVLVDRTPAAKRTSVYAAPVNTEYLGTYGADVEMSFGDLSLMVESAANFGEAWSADPSYGNIGHNGWMFNAGASYSFCDGKIVPRAKFYYLSGNKFVGDDISDGQLIKNVNREFSNYSPCNTNLSDSFYPAFDGGPYVFSGMGYSMNQGILRPTTFGDPYQMTNLVTPNVGMDLEFFGKLTVSLDYWYLQSAEPPIGADYDDITGMYSPYTLPSYMGNELDLYTEYAVNDNIVLSFLGGIFLPGDYYRKKRGDADLLGIAAAPRFDGGASTPWMIEAAVTYSF